MVRAEPGPAPSPPRRLAYAVALVLTAGAVAVHARVYTHAGPLWRDEVDSVVVAHSGSIAQVWHNLPYDSFPIGWHLAVRAWGDLFGTGDAAYRGLGLTVGLATLAALWWNARRFGTGPPLVGLLLLGYTPAVPIFGDSVRGHGLGMCLGVIAIGLFWDLSRGVSAGRAIAALAVSVAAVNVSFYDAPLVLAAGCGGAAAAAVARRQPRAAAGVLATGAACGATLLAYLPVYRGAGGVMKILRFHWSWPAAAGALVDGLRFNPGLGRGVGAWPFVWAAAVVGGIAIAVGLLARARSPVDRRALIVFSLATLLVGVTAEAAFYRTMSYRLQPWYFLALMTIAAAVLDPLWATGLGRGRGLAVATAVLAGWALPHDGSDAEVRRTNVDWAAATLDRSAGRGDLVVCIPWTYGTTLVHDYHGPARVVGVPPVMLDYARMDDLLPLMADPRWLDPFRADIAATLKSGHRVWVLANGLGPVPDRPIVPAPHPVWGWSDVYYYNAWELAVDHFVVLHAGELRVYALPPPGISGGRVSGYESPMLYAARGWRPE